MINNEEDPENLGGHGDQQSFAEFLKLLKDEFGDLLRTRQQGGSIVNYFQGATINNLVINGNMNKKGTEYYQSGGKGAAAQSYTDEVVGRAILALDGKDKPLCEKQLFLAVIKVLAYKCGWSGKWAKSCERINQLPIAEQLEVKCDANNLKAPSALKFASLEYSEWEDYEPKEGEREVFRKNKALAKLFEEELERQLLGTLD